MCIKTNESLKTVRYDRDVSSQLRFKFLETDLNTIDKIDELIRVRFEIKYKVKRSKQRK